FKVALTVLQKSDWSLKKRPRTEPMTSSPPARDLPLTLHLGGDHTMRTKDELFSSALVEINVALGSLFQGDDGGIDRFGDLHLIVQDRIHQLPVVEHDGALTSGKGEGLGPTQTDTDTQLANLGVLVNSARVAGHVQTWDTHAPGNLCDTHDIVEHGSRSLACTCPMTACLKTDAVHGCIHHWLTNDLLDHVGQFAALCEIDSFAAKATCLCESLFVHITNDNHSSAEQLRCRCTCQTNWSASCDIHSRPRCHASSESSVVA